ncbi:response regulator [Ideonella livida]|uniref:Response regulator n=1 Tax=Ideonella livida TaxID=2707176 RepID=A0A7C9THL7_9BURK|nr:response regulator [Ideonella livida]NDY90498.1 response regulator [Ideonella livida]
MTDNVPDVLTTQQAARRLGLSVSSVQKLVGRGELTAWITPGGHRRIDRAAVERLAQARRQGAPAPPEADAAPVPASAWDTVPAPPAPPLMSRAAAAAAATPGAAVQGLRVLLAEDDPDQVLWFRHALAAHHAGHRLIVAADASQALILLERERPDLLVTDLVMQPFDGFHLLRTLVAQPEWVGIEVLVLSGLSGDEIAARGGLPAGVSHFTKPVALERLLGLLDGAWARRQRAGAK